MKERIVIIFGMLFLLDWAVFAQSNKTVGGINVKTNNLRNIEYSDKIEQPSAI